MSRCSGDCCYAFPIHSAGLPVSPDELRERFGAEGKFVADMVIPILGPLAADGGYPRYTCKHFDGRDCQIYEDRPRLCREHGRSSRCDVPTCSFAPEPVIPLEQLKQSSARARSRTGEA